MDTSDIRETIKVKPWGKDQGDFVEINADDFDPHIHDPVDARAVRAADLDDGTVTAIAASKPPARKKAKGRK